jgi:hypothetical protein
MRGPSIAIRSIGAKAGGIPTEKWSDIHDFASAKMNYKI